MIQVRFWRVTTASGSVVLPAWTIGGMAASIRSIYPGPQESQAMLQLPCFRIGVAGSGSPPSTDLATWRMADFSPAAAFPAEVCSPSFRTVPETSGRLVKLRAAFFAYRHTMRFKKSRGPNWDTKTLQVCWRRTRAAAYGSDFSWAAL